MKNLISLTLLLALAATGFTQDKKKISTLQTLVDSERAFARMSEEKGTRPSFLAFIADDGILFRPRAVKGKQWMIDHPAPAANALPVLRWRPAFAEVAQAGDMGYTFGPWEYKSDIHQPRPVGFGHFVTVWKKQADGSWKFAVDLGIEHPEPTNSEEPLSEQLKNYEEPAKARAVNIEAERAILLRRERAFSDASAKRGARAAFLSNAAPNVRVFREGQLPFAGKEKAATVIPSGANLWTWQPEAWDVSRSGDLGYSYGTYQFKGEGTKPPETGNYFRVWKKQGGTWKVVVDLANPVPAK
jgi:ketosteroid isomerase-like protein